MKGAISLGKLFLTLNTWFTIKFCRGIEPKVVTTNTFTNA